jgi:hypothetical protein
MKHLNLLVIIMMLSSFISFGQNFALNLDGNDDKIIITDAPELNPTGAFTLEIWIKADSWKNNIYEGTIIGKQATGPDNGYCLTAGNNGRIEFTVGVNGSWQSIATDPILSLDTWYHVACVYDEANIYLYIDGDLKESQSLPGTYAPSTGTDLVLGDNPTWSGRNFPGTIDEVRITGIAKSASEIASTYTLEFTGSESDLLAFWPMNEGTGLTAGDVISTNHGTLTNMDETTDWVGGFEVPTCPSPSNLNASVTSTTADLSWIAGASETGWNFEYGGSGFSQGTGTVITTTDAYINLTGLSSDTDFQFYVQADCGSGDVSEWVGPYNFATTVSCPEPIDLTVSNITTTSATLSWNPGAAETNWEIEYGPEGFTQTEGTTVAATDTFVTLSTLTAMTGYDFYVRAICGVGDESAWAGANNFMTACDAISSFPYTQDFDGDWDCWTVINNDNDSYLWSQANNWITAHSGTWTAHGMGNNDDYLISPMLTLTGNEQIRWWDVVESSSYNNIYDILISTTNSDISSFTVNLGTIDCSNTDWQEHIINLDAYTGNVYIAFHQTYSAINNYGFGIDDFLVQEIPACPEPTSLETSNITATTAVLSWIEGFSETAWNIEYGETGFNQGDGTVITASDTFVNVTNLTPVTEYEFYVQSDCGSGELSTWTGPLSFTTLCDIFTPNYAQDFEAGFPPVCWLEAEGPVTGPTDYDGYPGWYNGSYTPFGSTVARIYMSGSSTEDWLLSPIFDLSAGGVYLTFDIAVSDYSGAAATMGSDDEILLLITLDGGANWMTMKTWNQSSSPSENGDHFSLDLSPLQAMAGSDAVQLAFWASTGTTSDTESFYFNLDNFEIRPVITDTDFITYSFAQETAPATINTTNHTIDVIVGNGIALDNLVAEFELSPYANATIGTDEQESGVTTNNFTAPVVYTVTAEDGSTTQDWTVNVTNASVLTETDILTFSFGEQTGDATIDATNHTVDIEVNFLADITNLTATYTLSYGAITNQSFTDFSDPVVYTVVAEDGTTTQDWTVTVTQESTPAGATCATAFAYANINDPEVVTDINAASRELWYTVVLDQFYSDVEFSTCASVYDTKLHIYDACDATNHLYYNDDDNVGFCAVDNNQSYISIPSLEPGTYYVKISTYSTTTNIDDPTTGLLVTGTLALSPAAEILTYSIPGQLSSNIIDSNDSIRVAMPATTPLDALVAEFTISDAASIAVGGTAQVSATTPNDWATTNPIVYTVTAEDATTRDWSVWVEIAGDESNITSYSIPLQVGDATIDETNHTIDIEMPSCTDLSSLVATFELSYAAQATVAGTDQESAVTTNDFTSAIVYTVTAEDGSTTDWTVNVTAQPTLVISAFPWVEDFEGNWAPICWLSTEWYQSTYGGAYSGSEWAYSNTAGSELVTPEIAIPATDAYSLSYWYRVESTTYPQDFEVLLSTDGINFDVTVQTETAYSNSAYAREIFDLSAYAGQSVWVKFVGQTGTGGSAYGVCFDDVAVYDNVSVGVKKMVSDNEVKVYPNPNNGQFNIALDINQEVNIEIVNTLGQVVANYDNVNSNTLTVDLSDEAKGLYIVRIASENNTITKKVNVIK